MMVAVFSEKRNPDVSLCSGADPFAKPVAMPADAPASHARRDIELLIRDPFQLENREGSTRHGTTQAAGGWDTLHAGPQRKQGLRSTRKIVR
jgi:hypothetical protein